MLFSQLIKSYQEQGYSKTSAVVKTVVEKYVLDSVIGFLTGAISGGVTSYGVNKVNTLKQTLADVDKFRILNKDYLPLPAMDESNNGHSGNNKENDLYYKAYSDDVKRKMAVDVGVDGQSDKTSAVNASEKVETEEEFLERINKEAYTNRRWAVENEGLLTNEEYKRYEDLKLGKITGEKQWMITDTTTGKHLLRVGKWIVLSENNFADAPIEKCINLKILKKEINCGRYYMMHQQKMKELTWKLWDTIVDMDLRTSICRKIIKIIMNSSDDIKATMEIQKILDTSKTEQEVLEKLEGFCQATKEKI